MTTLAMNTVKPPLTIPRPRRAGKSSVENSKFAAFVRRIIRALAKRVAVADVEALADLVALSVEVDQAITGAVLGLRRSGYTWVEIGAGLGLSKQAAQQRWGKLIDSTDTGGDR